jgi:mannose-6-phosphate isomerase
VYRLDNPVKNYAWGSRTHIPKLLGYPAAGKTEAEMWLGAHPSAPSLLQDGTRLDDLIANSPVQMLGQQTHDNFGARLPFLMKLLAAGEPLSLQVHPTSERARIRFAEQEAAGVDLRSPERSYQDASHKPELIYALTRFEGMAGFRDAAKTAEILRRLELPWLDSVADQIADSATPFQTLRTVVTEFLTWRGPFLEARLQQLKTSAVRAEQASHIPEVRRRPPRVEASHVDRESTRVYAAVVPLIDRYPADPGVLVTLLLNHVVLAAGEAMYIDAGVIHAYTSGFGVEIMAASDNVLRAGLTAKHVDIPELLEITNFTPTPPPLWAPSQSDRYGDALLAPPVEEFELSVCAVEEPRDVTVPSAPQIVLCLDGDVEATAGARTSLSRGQSIFVPERAGELTLTGAGRVAIGRPPR